MSKPVMIFAAGFGTRMKHLTKDRPKPLVVVGGLPLIDRAIAVAQDLPASKIVANLHYKADMLKHHLSGTRVETVTESPDILDTGGGLLNAADRLGSDPVITLNSDAIWQGRNPLKVLEAAWKPEFLDGLLMTIPLENALGYTGPGDFRRAENGSVSRGPGVVYGGAQIIKMELLQDIKETRFSLNRVWDLMIAENRLYSVEYEGKWCDVGHPQGITVAEALLQQEDV